MNDKSKLKPEQFLENAFYFTPDDLDANRAGSSSPKQRKDLQWRMIVMGILFICFLMAFFSSAFLSWQFGINDSRLLFFLSLGGLAGCLGTLNTLIRDGVSLYRGGVEQLTGRIRLNITNDNKYSGEISGRNFKLTKDQFLAFKNGDPYTIYYLPTSKRIVGVEWLRWGEEQDVIETEDQAGTDLAGEAELHARRSGR